MPVLLRIGDVARRTGVSVHTLRYYERLGLVTPTERRPSGYREYERSIIEHIRGIRLAQDLGFTLDEIRALIVHNERPSAAGVKKIRTLADTKIGELEAAIADLARKRDVLVQLRSACTCDGTRSIALPRMLSATKLDA